MSLPPLPDYLPSEADLNTMSDRTARRWLHVIAESDPDLVDVTVNTLEITAPLAGPVRILREVMFWINKRAIR